MIPAIETTADLRRFAPPVVMRAVHLVLGCEGVPPGDVADAIRMLEVRGRRDGLQAAEENDPERNGPAWNRRRQAKLDAYSAGAIAELLSLVRLELTRGPSA